LTVDYDTLDRGADAVVLKVLDQQSRENLLRTANGCAVHVFDEQGREVGLLRLGGPKCEACRIIRVRARSVQCESGPRE